MTQQTVPVLHAPLQGMMYVLSIRVVLPGIIARTLVVASFRPGTQAEERYTIQTWHKRLCHINHAAERRLATSNLVDGLQILTEHQFIDL
jgi:hypothetical protein